MAQYEAITFNAALQAATTHFANAVSQREKEGRDPMEPQFLDQAFQNAITVGDEFANRLMATAEPDDIPA